MKENLTCDEICLGYQLALHFDQHDLKKFCQREIMKNTFVVLQSEGFLNCDWNVLMEIVKMDRLNCHESALLEACLNWARTSCKKDKLNVEQKIVRDQLKSVIYEIRFKKITISDLAKLMNDSTCPYNIDDFKDIVRIMARENITSTKFNCSNRLPYLITWNISKKLVCNRVPSISSRYKDIPNILSTTFSSNKPFIFGAFYINHFSPRICYRCDISVEVMDFGTKYDVLKFKEQICDGDTITLPEPIMIQENIKYKIQLDFSSYNYKLLSRCNCFLGGGEILHSSAVITFYKDFADHIIPTLYFNELEN